MAEEKPLKNIRVIDFGQYISAPASAMIMADLGAEVIHIDPPTGRRWDNPAAAMLNRGKKCIKLDLKTDVGVAEAIGLIKTADVVIENFRPFVMDKLGLGADKMCKLNPALIYVSIPGFASTDKNRAHIQAWEGIISAACGVFSDMGANRILMGIEPSFSPLALASSYGAVLATLSINLAIYNRNKTGIGEQIEINLASALMEGLAYNSLGLENYPKRYKSLREREINRRKKQNIPMGMSYEQLQVLLDPFFRPYVCKDGRNFYIVSASHKNHPTIILKELGLWQQLVDEGLPLHDAYTNSSDWGSDDCSLFSYPLSQSLAIRVSELIGEKLKQKTAYEWENIFGKLFAPAAAVRTTAEWINSEHANDSKLIVAVDEAEYGVMKQLGALVWYKSQAQQYTMFSGQQNIKITDIEEHKIKLPNAPKQPTKSWLEGIKILDITNVIAGPTIASTLSRFGAEIINISPTEPTMDAWNGIIFACQAGRGKESVLIDIKNKRGKQAFIKMLKWADVLTCNAVDKQMQRLGLTESEIKKINSKLIVCQLDCYGGPSIGHRSNYPGYDNLVQASTGIMARFGGGIDTPEDHAYFGTIDVLAGFAGALAVASALIKRQQTGNGDIVHTSLASSGQLVQVPFMYDFKNRQPFDEPSGRDIKGASSLYRAYETKNGWIFLGVKKSDLKKLERVLQIEISDNLADDLLGEKLEKTFIKKDRTKIINQLQKNNIGAYELSKMVNVRDNNLQIQNNDTTAFNADTFQFIRDDNHPSCRKVDLVAPNAVRPKNTTITVPSATQKPGASTVKILKKFGYSQAEITEMKKQGIIAEQWSDDYLPV